MAASTSTVTQFGASQMHIGAFTYGENNIRVQQWREGSNLIIGKFCSIAEGVTVMLGGNHRTDWATTYPFGHIYRRELGRPGIVGHPTSRGDVIVGDDVWIGQNAVILSGVTIGTGAVIGAFSVVSKDVAPYTIAAGNPARPVRQRFSDEIIELLMTLRWWDLDVNEIKGIAAILSQEPDRTWLEELISRFRRG